MRASARPGADLLDGDVGHGINVISRQRRQILWNVSQMSLSSLCQETGVSAGFSGTGLGGSGCDTGLLAERSRSWHYASMAVQITIRDVPDKVRNELAGRAASQGKSMQEFLRAELERLAARPSIEMWLEQARSRKKAARTRISAAQILKYRDADRR